MFLIEVIPLSRGIGKDTLSYFSAAPIAAGSLVSVPLRKRVISALVLSSAPAREAKASIRTSEFTIRKVDQFKAAHFLSEAFMRAAARAAGLSASSIGSVLSLLVPKALLETPPETRPQTSAVATGTFDALALQADNDERFGSYRSLIREEFARRRSVFLCLPTAEDVKRFARVLPKGIEGYTYALYGTLPKKKLREAWQAALAEEHPVLIIATGLFFSVCRPDIGAVIIEEESSRFYKTPVRPFLDLRMFAEVFAKELRARLILGDAFLRTETIYRVKSGEVAELVPLKFRSLSTVKSVVIDMKSEKKASNGVFESVSPELGDLIRESHERNEHLFLFCSRRGLASQTVCGDCGTAVLCNRCHSPITLHRARTGDGNQNFFFCHACGEKRSAEERCTHCRSWKLRPLGIGLELVEAELEKKFPFIKVFRIDKESASTAVRAAKNASAFFAAPGSILLGTEMALSYLDRPVENSAVVSLDSLFSLPDFRIHERIFHLLLKIRSLTLGALLVQTRVPNERVLEYAHSGNLMDFYREEVAAREAFRYPPFTTLVKLSLAGTRAAVQKEMEKLKTYFAPTEVETFPAFIEESRGAFTMHALLRLPRGVWPERDLLQKLLSLPPQFRVEIEPESLL